MLQSNKSYSSNLKDIFNPDSQTPQNCPTKQALYHARHKIKPSAFTAINTLLTTEFYGVNKQHLSNFCGLRPLAIDGTGFRLEDQAYDQMLKELIDKEGNELAPSILNPQAPVIRGSVLHDISNEVIVDIKAGSNLYSEHEFAIQHLDRVDSETDLMIFDRGYHALWFLLFLNMNGKKFICRGKRQKFIGEFLETGKDEDIVELTVKSSHLNTTPRHKKFIAEAGIKTTNKLKLRLVRYEEENEFGEVVSYVMVSNLLDEKRYPTSKFKDLYRLRWRVEEAIKTYKISIEVERWSGISWFTAQQDIERAALLYNFTRMNTYGVDEKIREETQKKLASKKLKYAQKLNITEALRAMRGLLRSVVRVGFKINPVKRLIGFLKTVAADKTDIKPNRSFSRDIKNSAKRFHMNCKSNT